MPCSCGCCRDTTGSLCPCLETRVRIAQVVRLPLVSVGELRGVIYRAKGLPGETPKTYVHFFKGQLPMLVTSPTGTRLYIIGGRYRVTRRGIQG